MDTSLLKFASLSDVMERMGFDDGEYFLAHVQDLLVSHGVDPNITFRQLYKLFNVEFVVAVANVLTYETEFLSIHTTPSMRVVDAVRASCGVPFLVPPVRVGPKKLYVDGSVIANYPYSYITEQPARAGDHVIGCNIASWKPCEVECFSDLMYGVLGCVFSAGSSRGWPNTVEIDCSGVSYFDFDKPHSERQKLFDTGYRQTVEYLDTKTSTQMTRHRRSSSI